MSFMQKIFGNPAPTGTPPINPNVPTTTNNLQTNPTPVGTVQTNKTAPNGIIPEGGADPSKQVVSPLDPFKDLWQNTPTDPDAPKPEVPITAQQMMEAAAKVDFSRVITPEELAKISAGGADAQKAFISAMNKMSQASYGQSTIVTQKLVDIAVNKAREEFQASLPSLVKRQALGDLSISENPALNNPVVAPVIAAIQSQLVEKYPKATPSELQDMAKKIMTGAAEMFVPKQKDSNPKVKEDEDWAIYLK